MMLLCRLGFHRWRYRAYPDHRMAERHCARCLVAQLQMGDGAIWRPM